MKIQRNPYNSKPSPTAATQQYEIPSTQEKTHKETPQEKTLSKYASHTIPYNGRTLRVYIKLTDEQGNILYPNSKETVLPPKLKQNIETAFKAMLKSVENEGKCSLENPIKNFHPKGIVTEDGTSHNLVGMEQWKEFIKVVGWNQERVTAAGSSENRSEACLKKPNLMPITYPKKGIADIKGPELVLLGKAHVHPRDFKGLSIGSNAIVNVADAYNTLPIATKLRILNTLLIDPAIATIGIYQWVRDQLIQDEEKSSQETTPADKDQDTEKAIRKEIQKLEQESSKNRFLDDVDRDLIDSLYTNFLKRESGSPITEERIWDIKHLMNRRLPNKETLVEHYRAIYRAKQKELPEYTLTPEDFSDYWFNYKHSKQNMADQNEIVTNFVEAMVSWADTGGEKLEKNYCLSTKTEGSAADPTLSWALSILDKIPRLSTYVPESFKGRKKEGWGEYVNLYDAGLMIASYAALSPATAGANTMPTSQALVGYNPPTTPIGSDSLMLPVLQTAAAITLLCHKIDSITDRVIKANDWICATGNTVAQKMETPIDYTKKVVGLAALGPIKLVQAGTAVYHYGPIQRTREAGNAVIQAFTSKPDVGKK